MTRFMRPTATGAMLCAVVVFNLAAQAEVDTPAAAAGSIDLGEMDTPDRSHTYPGLPDADPLMQDPEQAREALRLQVREALDLAAEVDATRILVHVTSLHVVRLNGVVDDDAARMAAEVIAASVQGVASVENRLTLEEDAD